MKRITMLPLSCLVLLCAIAATSTSIQTFAHTDKYYLGYSQGQTKATADYYVIDNGHNDYNPRCPTSDAWNQANGPHSSNFCAGFIDGYNAQWTSLAPNFMAWHNQRVEQSTSQSVSIKGDNNKVVQQAINNVGNSGSGYGRGHGSYQPNCSFLCSIIEVN